MRKLERAQEKEKGLLQEMKVTNSDITKAHSLLEKVTDISNYCKSIERPVARRIVLVAFLIIAFIIAVAVKLYPLLANFMQCHIDIANTALALVSGGILALFVTIIWLLSSFFITGKPLNFKEALMLLQEKAIKREKAKYIIRKRYELALIDLSAEAVQKEQETLERDLTEKLKCLQAELDSVRQEQETLESRLSKTIP